MPDSAFDAWYNEIEGFALRAERLTGPKDELQAAFEAGAAAASEAMRENRGVLGRHWDDETKTFREALPPLPQRELSPTTEADILARIFRQRRRIRTRLTVPSEKQPLQSDDKTELEAINALLADIEKAMGLAATPNQTGEVDRT